MQRGCGNIFLILFAWLGPAHAFAQPIVQTPTLDRPAGYYPDSVFVNILCANPGAALHYTLNGDEPTLISPLYTQPLLIKDRASVPNSLSLIPTNPGFNFPVPGYDSGRADDRGWLPPYDTVNKCTVLKVKAFLNGYLPSKTVTATYFIGAQLNNRYPFPVISISADSMDLFSDSTGLFVYGNDTADKGNFAKPRFEKEIYFEYFDTEGNRMLSQHCGMQIHGHGGEYAPQKSLWLINRDAYGKTEFDYPFFGEGSFPLKDILVRNGGHRPDCFPRDDLGGKIVKGLSYDMQSEQHCIVFVNGEYWGIQTIKNLLNLHYLVSKYHINRYDAAVISGGGVLDDGVPGDEQHYLNVIGFIQYANIATQQNYDYVNTQLDLQSFTDFECSEIWLGNGDWPNNNTKMWRFKRSYDAGATNELDGRWHWMMYDLDAAFGGDCNTITASFNTLSNAFDSTFGSSTLVLRTLINNASYKNYFINRFADLLNTTFLPSRVRGIMNALDNELTPSMMEHVSRWRYPSVSTTLQARALETPSLTKWNTINSSLYNYAGLRPYKVRRHILNYFGLADTVKITLNVSDTSAGKIKMNTIYIDRFTQGINAAPYPWTGTYFNGNAVSIEAIANPGFRFLNWNDPSKTQNPLTTNVTADTSVTAVFAPDTGFNSIHYLYINELMSRNDQYLHDDYDEFDDWIELYNPNNFAVDVANCYVSDDASQKNKYRIGEGNHSTVIPARGFILLWADNSPEQGVTHTNFKLRASGGGIWLTLPDGRTVVDSVIYPSQITDHSWGRAMDGDSAWIDWNKPTPRSSNILLPDTHLPEALLYPNPAYNTQYIYFTVPVDAVISDALGNRIAELHQASRFDVTLLAKGVYFFHAESGEIIKFVKL